MSSDVSRSGADEVAAGEQRSVLRRLLSADLLISSVLLAVFVAAFVGAQDWPFESRMFPVMVTSAGAVLALLKMALSLRAPRSAAPAGHRQLGGVELTDEDEEDDQALEYVFERATRAEWLRVLAWLAGFFLALLLVGATATILVFTVLYLLVEARTTVVIAVVYAALLGGALYAARELLNIALPPGILLS